MKTEWQKCPVWTGHDKVQSWALVKVVMNH
jgi:hypothetical protein